MALFMKDSTIPNTDITLPVPPVLDLALPKHTLLPPPPPVPLFHTYHPYNRLSLLTSPLTSCHMKAPCPPTITPPLLSPSDPEAMCEAAARLLFMNVKWAKNVPAFASLSLSDRILLLEESWRDLFIIGSAQFLYPLDLKILLNSKKLKIDPKEIEDFQTALAEFIKNRPDSNEYACLRAIVLFKTSFGDKLIGSPSQTNVETKKLQDLPAVASLQDHSQVVLNEVK